MPLLWLRVAAALYGVGLIYALLALARRGETLGRFVVAVMGLGMAFHFVSIAEALLEGRMTAASMRDPASVLAFLLLAFFMAVFARFGTITPGIFVFPLAFVLTFVAALGDQPAHFASATVRTGWIFLHVALVSIGIAGLFFSVSAGLLYLMQERSLKAKRESPWLARLPALEVVDQIGYRSLLFGFPFMTFGLITGAVLAQAEYGAMYFRDAKVMLSVLMWAVYMLLLYTRWSAGWRGRRAALLSSLAFVTAVGAWLANYVGALQEALRQ